MKGVINVGRVVVMDIGLRVIGFGEVVIGVRWVIADCFRNR